MRAIKISKGICEPVYNLTVNNKHIYVLFNGCIVHNCERRFLGWVPKTFSETLGDSTTFQHVPAEDAYKYACLAEHERVLMADRSNRRICEIEVGDEVLTPDGPHKVTAVYNNGIRPCYRLVWNGGVVTIATGNHQFKFFDLSTDTEVWKTVDEVFELYQHNPKTILSAVRITPTGKHTAFQLCGISKFRPCVVYDIQVEEVHCFVLANGVVSHNCTDALGTYNLGLISNKFYKESYPASKYDNDSLYPMMRMENTPQRLDLDYLKSLRGEVDAREEESLKRVYQLAGCTFNVNSPAQFGKILVEHFGVDTGQRTATGAMKADLKTLNAWMTKHSARIGEELREFMDAYQEYKKVVKFKSSYLEKYIKAAEEADTFPIRFSYKFQSVPCLTENNTVLVKYRGFISIKDVIENDLIWTAWGYKKVLWNRSHGVDEFYRVTLENGMILEGTGHHPVLVRKSPLEDISPKGMTKDDVEWAGIQDLKEGEPVIINHTPSALSCNESWKCNLARIMGYFFGKGRVTDQVLMTLCFDDISMAAFYRDMMYRVFGKNKVHRYDLDRIRVEYSITRHILVEFLSEHGIIQKPKTDKQGNWILSTVNAYTKVADAFSRCPDTFRHFLVGYLDSKKTSLKEMGYKEIPEDWTDGISSDRVVFVIPTSEKDVVIPMLWAQAISFSVTDHKFKAWFGEGKVTRIEISDPLALSNLLSLWNSGDAGLTRFREVKLPKEFRMYAESSVKSVECVKESTTVYDIEVYEVHEYVANGIITHNTGRISCGGDANNTYFTNNNVQSTPKPHSMMIKGRRATEKEILEKQDILGWYFSNDIPDEDAIGLVEGMDPHMNIRRAFLPENDDCYVVSIDMSGEELRVVANIYNEKTWVNAFNNGDDVHKSTALKLFGPENYSKEARKKAKCLSGDSLVQTNKGIISLKRLYSAWSDVNFRDGLEVSTPSGMCRILDVMNNGIRRVYKLSMSSGEVLSATGDHLVRSRGKWVTVSSLCVGDVIDADVCVTEVVDVPSISLPLISGCSINLSDDIAYLFGAVLGDGCIDSKNVRFFSEDIELLDEVERIALNLGFSPKRILFRTGKNGKPFYRMIVGAKLCIALFSGAGLVDEKGHKCLKVPDSLYKAPVSCRFAFLQGIFDTDGTITRKSTCTSCGLNFCTASLEFARECAALCRSVGLMCRVSSDFNKAYGRYYFKVRVRSSSVRQFDALGGFKCVHKQDALNEWLFAGLCKRSYQKEYKILGIADDTSEVFDISVDSTEHAFFANGLVVHNCASFGMLYGSGAQGFNQSFPDMSLEECRQFLAKFKAALPAITQGQDESVAYAREHGTINTGYGRQRRVRSYFQSGDRAKIAFAERTTKNCYSPDTEFLTEDGWKLAVDITPTTQLAYYNPEDGTISYCDAGERYTNVCLQSVLYDDGMYSWNVTENHRMWVSYDRINFERKYASELLDDKIWYELDFDGKTGTGIRVMVESGITLITHKPKEFSCFEVPTHLLVTRHKGCVSIHMNTVVQGTAADVLKLIICRLWTNVFKPYPQVKFMSTIHDEVNFSMPRELAREVIPICMKCMTIEREDWPVVLECSLSLGRVSLGDLIPFTYNHETKEFVPEWEKSDAVLKKRTGHAEEASSGTDSTEAEDPYFGLPPEACEF